MTITDYLTKYGLTPGGFAKRIGVSRSQLRDWMRGSDITGDNIWKIVDATGGEVGPSDVRAMRVRPVEVGDEDAPESAPAPVDGEAA